MSGKIKILVNLSLNLHGEHQRKKRKSDRNKMQLKLMLQFSLINYHLLNYLVKWGVLSSGKHGKHSFLLEIKLRCKSYVKPWNAIFRQISETIGKSPRKNFGNLFQETGCSKPICLRGRSGISSASSPQVSAPPLPQKLWWEAKLNSSPKKWGKETFFVPKICSKRD